MDIKLIRENPDEARLPDVLSRLRAGDLLIITADHGNDPTTSSTDHSREYVPLLAYGPGLARGVGLGRRGTFADLGATIGQMFGVKTEAGTSFLGELSGP